MFYVNKYALTNVNNSIFHKDRLDTLKQMSTDDRLSHLIFYGPEGSGKKTLINKFLEMTFDKSVRDIKECPYLVTSSGNVQTQINIQQSNYHIIIEPNNNNSDRYLVQDVVNEYAKRIPLNIFTSKKPFKVVVINNVDCMSYYAQTSLRRTMEKYSDTCRFIMWCRSLTRVIDPLRSRCYCFRVMAPSHSEIFTNLVRVACEEGFKLKLQEYLNIVKLANNNIKTSLWLLQLCNLKMTYNSSYDDALELIVNNIVQKNNVASLENILKMRDILYKIMVKNISGTKILKNITDLLLLNETIDFKKKSIIVEEAAKYDYRIVKGRREIIHIEGFIVSCMQLLL
jgi:replication factor C subunit 3/5